MTETGEGSDVDPSSIEPLSDDEGVYQRGSDGQLQPLEWSVIEYDGKKRKIRPYPIPMGDVEDLQDLGTDIDMTKLCEILEEKIHTPNRTVDEWKDTDPRQVTAVIEELARMAGGDAPSNEFHNEVRQELTERETAAPGN